MEPIVCDYLKIGSKTYAVKEIEAENLDINEELRQAYETKYNEKLEELRNGVVETMEDEWDTQIKHIQSFRNRGEVRVPEDMFGELICVIDNRVQEARVVRYSPTEIVCNWSRLPIDVRENLSRESEIADAFTEIGVETPVTIKLKESLVIPLVISYNPATDTLRVLKDRYFHSYSDGRICTGTHTAKQFWTSSNFDEHINRINWFSPASSYVKYKNTTCSLLEYLNTDTYNGVETTTPREGELAWRT